MKDKGTELLFQFNAEKMSEQQKQDAVRAFKEAAIFSPVVGRAFLPGHGLSLLFRIKAGEATKQ